MTEPITASQTVGPFFAMRLPWADGPFVVPEGTPGAVTIIGRVFDGAGNTIPDAMIETWQADPDGRFAHPDDPRGASAAGYRSFRGFGRCATSPDGSYRIVTLKPGPLPVPRRGDRGAAYRHIGFRAGPAGPPGHPAVLSRRGRSERRRPGAVLDSRTRPS